MSFNSRTPHSEEIIDGENLSPSKITDIEVTKGKVFTIIDGGTKLTFIDEFVSGIFSDENCNSTLYPISQGFYFLRDGEENLTDYALTSEDYIKSIIPDEVNHGEDAFQIGNINSSKMYIIYAGNGSGSWKTLNLEESQDALEKINFDSSGQ